MTGVLNPYEDTSCYTYEVTMIVQVIAPTRQIADEKLDRDGGYISKRDVVFKNSTLLYKYGLETDDATTLLEEGEI